MILFKVWEISSTVVRSWALGLNIIELESWYHFLSALGKLLQFSKPQFYLKYEW